MEQNTFELLDEVEKDIVDVPTEPKLKEYEKLLLDERDRKDIEKAKNLVKFGCFLQEIKNEVNFNELEQIKMPKKYNGRFDLYRNKETLELLFINPLVEDNKGDADERKDLKPYAYDVIAIEQMDNETYVMVCKSAKNNLKSSVKLAYKFAIVFYFINLVVASCIFIYNIFSGIGEGVADFKAFINLIFSTFYVSGTYISGILVASPLIVLMMIKYKQYKEQ